MLRALAMAVTPWAALAGTQKVARVIWIAAVGETARASILAALGRQGLVDGGNLSVRFERQEVQNDEARLREIVATQPDVIVVHGAPDVLRSITHDTPVVFYDYAVDPVQMGLVESFRRPGGNVTGTHVPWHEIQSKQWQLLKDFNPAMKVGGVVYATEDADAADPWAESHKKEMDKHRDLDAEARLLTERQLGIRIVDIKIPRTSTQAQIAEAVGRSGAEALLVDFPRTDGWLAFVKATRKPTCVYTFRATRAGMGIVGISFDADEGIDQSAERVARIIRGESPATIPIYIVRKYGVAVNARIARAAGIRIPPSVLLQAEEKYE